MSPPVPGPVMTAAGCAGRGPELAAYGDLAALGAFVTRTVTLASRRGGPMPRVLDTPGGLLHAVGLENPGIDRFLAIELPWLVQHRATVVVSVAGADLAEHVELARRLAASPGVTGVELDLAEPHPGSLGVVETSEPRASPLVARRIVTAVRETLPAEVAVLAKVRADPGRTPDHARALADAGADAVVVGHALPAAMPDGRTCGLSGPALLPLTRLTVAETLRAHPGLTLVAAGGIAEPGQARGMLELGARAVQVGSALLVDPTAAHRIARDLDQDRHEHTHDDGQGPTP